MIVDAQFTNQLLFSFLVALMGALVGGAVRWGGVRRERRLRLTLELYSEFHSPAFNHLRILAHGALDKAASMPRGYETASGEARDAVASVVHFWEKVALLTRAGAVEMSLARRFFGQYARWWSALLCERAGALDDPEWGATLRDIHWLFARLRTSTREGSRR